MTMDYDLWLRIGKRFPVDHVDAVWGVQRLHDDAKTIRERSVARAARGQPPPRRAARLADGDEPLRRAAAPAPTRESDGRIAYARRGSKSDGPRARRDVKLLERAVGRPVSRPSRSTMLRRRPARCTRCSAIRPSAGRENAATYSTWTYTSPSIVEIRTHLERHGLSLVNWTLSGTAGLFGRGAGSRRDRQRAHVELIRATHGDGASNALYGSYLRSFDGFIAGYPPCFSLLYEGPRASRRSSSRRRGTSSRTTHYAPHWTWLDEHLRTGVEERLAHARREQPRRCRLPRDTSPA